MHIATLWNHADLPACPGNQIWIQHSFATENGMEFDFSENTDAANISYGLYGILFWIPILVPCSLELVSPQQLRT